MATAYVAMKHFNQRDASVVPQLATLQDCSVQFSTMTVGDSSSGTTRATTTTGGGGGGDDKEDDDPTNSIRAVLQATKEALLVSVAGQERIDTEALPCAVLSPPNQDKTALQIQVLTNSFQLPVVVYDSESDLLLQQQYPSTVGLVVSTQRRATALASYLQQAVDRSDLVMLYPKDEPSAHDLAQALQEQQQQYALNVHLLTEDESVRAMTKEDRRALLQQVQLTGIRTIFLNFDRFEILQEYAVLLQEENMLTFDFLYVLSSRVPLVVASDDDDDDENNTNATNSGSSAMKQLLAGAMTFQPLDGFAQNNPQDDPFWQAWKQQNATDVAYLNTLLPFSAKQSFQPPADYFQTTNPVAGASFLYDAIMTIGFGACQQSIFDSNDFGNTTTTTTTTSATASTTTGDRFLQQQQQGTGAADPLVPAMLESSFQGASGWVRFSAGQKVREPSDVTMGLWNVRPNSNNNDNNKSAVAPSARSSTTRDISNETAFGRTVVSLLTNESSWDDIEGVPFIYRDGSTTPPTSSRYILEENFLAQWVRIVGLILWGVALTLGLACLVAIRYLRNDPIVRRAQPFFLGLLCVGSIIMSTAVFTLSWDEGAGWSDHQLDVACMATPWFFFVGHTLSFCALFTKLWRLDRVLQFRRGAVTIRHVIGPLMGLMSAALLVLILWTALDPWTWQRELISEIPSETYGHCKNDHFWAFFGPLMGLLVLAEGLTAFFAWKTSDVPEDFRESSSVVTAICIQLQAWIVGVPILGVLGTDSTNATYIGRILLVFIFSVSSVAVVVVTKVYHAMLLKINPEAANKKKNRVNVTTASSGTVRVSGLNSSDPRSAAASSSSTSRKDSSIVQASYTSPSSDDTSLNNRDDSMMMVNTTQSTSPARTADATVSDTELKSVDATVESSKDDGVLGPSAMEEPWEQDKEQEGRFPVTTGMAAMELVAGATKNESDKTHHTGEHPKEQTNTRKQHHHTQTELMQLIPAALSDRRYTDALSYLDECVDWMDSGGIAPSKLMFDRKFICYNIGKACLGLEDFEGAHAALREALFAQGKMVDEDSILQLMDQVQFLASIQGQDEQEI